MSVDKLIGVHPVLVEKVMRIRAAAAALGFPMIVTDGVRTLADQQALFAKGRTVPGIRVTNVDGVRSRSNHQPHEDGFGHAVDLTFLVDGKPSWETSLPWRLYGEMAKALGLKWGGEFTTITDRPHIELPAAPQTKNA
jgi:peptidoglycan L-alanyl-D-glutamate endopeptidase CwlK